MMSSKKKVRVLMTDAGLQSDLESPSDSDWREERQGLTNGVSNGTSEHRDDKHRNKDLEYSDKDKSRDKDKDCHRDEKKHSSSGERKERDKNRHSSSGHKSHRDKVKELKRHKEQNCEKEREREFEYKDVKPELHESLEDCITIKEEPVESEEVVKLVINEPMMEEDVEDLPHSHHKHIKEDDGDDDKLLPIHKKVESDLKEKRKKIRDEDEDEDLKQMIISEAIISSDTNRSVLILKHMEVELAEWYRSHELLYNKNLKAYWDRGRKEEMYRKKAKELRITVAELQQWLESMRTLYAKAVAAESVEGCEKLSEREAWIKEACAFLRPHIAMFQGPSIKQSPSNEEDSLEIEVERSGDGGLAADVHAPKGKKGCSCKKLRMKALDPAAGHATSDQMAPPIKKRRPNFISKELLALVSGVRERWHVITGPLSSSLTAAAKHQAWEAVAAEVNAVTHVVRTMEEVRTKFTDFKSSTKKKAALAKELTSTGCGTGRFPCLTDAEEAMVRLLDQEAVEAAPAKLESLPHQQNCLFTGRAVGESPIEVGTNHGAEAVPGAHTLSVHTETSIVSEETTPQHILMDEDGHCSIIPPQPSSHSAMEVVLAESTAPAASLFIPASPQPGPSCPSTPQGPPRGAGPRRRYTDRSVAPQMMEIQQGLLTEVRNMRASMDRVADQIEAMNSNLEVIANAMTQIAGKKS